MKKYLLALLLISTFAIAGKEPRHKIEYNLPATVQTLTITSIANSLPSFQLVDALGNSGNVHCVTQGPATIDLLPDGNRVVFKISSFQYVLDVTTDAIIIDGSNYSTPSSHVTGSALQIKLAQLFPKTNSSSGGSGGSFSKNADSLGSQPAGYYATSSQQSTNTTAIATETTNRTNANNLKVNISDTAAAFNAYRTGMIANAAAISNETTNRINADNLKQDAATAVTLTGSQTIYNKSIPSVLTSASDLTTIEAWGDSHTAGAGQTPWTTTLASLSGLTVNNNGVGGETSTQIKTRFDAATTAQKARPTIIWAGFNDYATDNTYTTVKSNIAAMVAALGHTSYLIIGEVMSVNAGFDAGAAGWLNKMQFNRDLAATYGHHFFDVHSFLMSNYSSADATDLANYLTDQEPNTLRIDLQHFTSAANALIGAEIYRRIKDLGVGFTTLDRAAIYNTTISPVNVGGGVKSPGRFSYLESDKLSIRNNGAIMFEGIPVINSFRKSYYIGEGSGTAQRTGTGTSALYNNVLGYGSLNNSGLTGNLNVVLGSLSATNITSATNTVTIGNQVDANGGTSSNALNIMNMIFGAALNSTGTTLPTNGRIGIKQNNLTSTFTLGGSFASPIQAKTAAYTLAESDYTVNYTSGTVTATLPTAVGCSGRIYTIKNSGAGAITVATTSSQTIDGATTYSLSTQYKYVTVQSNNANWIITANN